VAYWSDIWVFFSCHIRLKALEKKNGYELKKIEELEKTRQEDREIIADLQKNFQELKSRN
jgi:hypothetical protein